MMVVRLLDKASPAAPLPRSVQLALNVSVIVAVFLIGLSLFLLAIAPIKAWKT